MVGFESSLRHGLSGSDDVGHLFLTHANFESALADELLPARSVSLDPGRLASDRELSTGSFLAFARQALPNVIQVEANSINLWADRIVESIVGVLPDDQPWRLHVWPEYGEGRAGQHRCQLVRSSLMAKLKKRRRRLARQLDEAPSAFTPVCSLVQCLLTAPEAGWLSVSAAPRPFDLRTVLSCFPGGIVSLAEDRRAPSRAFAKLVEAELQLGVQIIGGDACVDLGASPGSWSYLALQRGAQVTAIDRSELREDMMRNPRLKFVMADAFKFEPSEPVDWLLCDVIAAPQRSVALLLDWLRAGWMRHFVVTIKFKGGDDYQVLDLLKQQAAPLCSEFRLKRLCANKNEVCAFGTV